MKTKIFCDSADIKVIKKLNNNTLVSGFTTNPSLMRLSGARNYKNYSKKILKICKKKPISFEVFADDLEEMEKQRPKDRCDFLLSFSIFLIISHRKREK